LCFERRFSKQNSVIRLKSNILAPQNFWAGYATGLHSHLHKIGLHPDGLCDTCGIPETVEPFLMQCRKYAEARHALQRPIQHLNINFDWITFLKNTRTFSFVIAFLNKQDEHCNKEPQKYVVALQNHAVESANNPNNNNN